MKRAIFLDRDNTLIHDPGYIHEPSKVKLLEGVGKGLKLLKEKGFLLIVVSNQSGIGRGYYRESDFHKVNEKLQELLKDYDVQIDDFFFCPHKPEDNCPCRKPKPELAFTASKKWNIDLKSSYMIGDKDSDVEFGLLAGMKGCFKVGNEIFPTFLECAKFIVEVLEK